MIQKIILEAMTELVISLKHFLLGTRFIPPLEYGRQSLALLIYKRLLLQLMALIIFLLLLMEEIHGHKELRLASVTGDK
jgi:hypothetical protein